MTAKKNLTDDFFCILSQPKVLNVLELCLDCLTNLAVGCLLGYRAEKYDYVRNEFGV